MSARVKQPPGQEEAGQTIPIVYVDPSPPAVELQALSDLLRTLSLEDPQETEGRLRVQPGSKAPTS